MYLDTSAAAKLYLPEPESLSVGVSRYESDGAAEEFMKLFGKLGRYRRTSGQVGEPAE